MYVREMKLQKLLFSLGPRMCVKQHSHAWCTLYIKSKYGNRVTDAHLQDNLIIATITYEPRFRKHAL